MNKTKQNGWSVDGLSVSTSRSATKKGSFCTCYLSLQSSDITSSQDLEKNWYIARCDTNQSDYVNVTGLDSYELFLQGTQSTDFVIHGQHRKWHHVIYYARHFPALLECTWCTLVLWSLDETLLDDWGHCHKWQPTFFLQAVQHHCSCIRSNFFDILSRFV